MEISRVSLNNSNIKEITEKIKSEIITESYNHLELIFDGYSIFVSFVIDHDGENYNLLKDDISFIACVDDFEPKNTYGISVDEDFDDKHFDELKKCILCKVD